ncbi:MAG: AarF/ABC1/UbiB kinase family protein, partial [Flavobacteriaceae bacterium]
FGCIKLVPDTFYGPYFELAQKETFDNDTLFTEKLYELEILKAEDAPEELKFFKQLFREMLTLFTAPFHEEHFEFGSTEFWSKITDLGQRYASDDQIRKMNGNRGSKHFLYMNRTFFGLFNLLHDLKATVAVNHFRKYMR